MYIPIGAAKIVLFLHIRKKKVQFVEKPALFLLGSSSIIYSSMPKAQVHLFSVGYSLDIRLLYVSYQPKIIVTPP